MLHSSLQGEWTPGRCLQLQEATQIEQLCLLMNRLQQLPETRIAEIKLVLGVAIRFGDNSAIELHAAKGTKFLNDYLSDRDDYINVMEYNRAADPRTTGELDRLKLIETNADQALQCLRRVMSSDEDMGDEDIKEVEEAIEYLEKVA